MCLHKRGRLFKRKIHFNLKGFANIVTNKVRITGVIRTLFVFQYNSKKNSNKRTLQLTKYELLCKMVL